MSTRHPSSPSAGSGTIGTGQRLAVKGLTGATRCCGRSSRGVESTMLARQFALASFAKALTDYGTSGSPPPRVTILRGLDARRVMIAPPQIQFGRKMLRRLAVWFAARGPNAGQTDLSSKLLKARFNFVFRARRVFQSDPFRQHSPPFDMSFQRPRSGCADGLWCWQRRDPLQPHRHLSGCDLGVSRARLAPGLGLRACVLVHAIDHCPSTSPAAQATLSSPQKCLTLFQMAGFEPIWTHSSVMRFLRVFPDIVEFENQVNIRQCLILRHLPKESTCNDLNAKRICHADRNILHLLLPRSNAATILSCNSRTLSLATTTVAARLYPGREDPRPRAFPRGDSTASQGLESGVRDGTLISCSAFSRHRHDAPAQYDRGRTLYPDLGCSCSDNCGVVGVSDADGVDGGCDDAGGAEGGADDADDSDGGSDDGDSNAGDSNDGG